uniref:Cytosolic fatty-acid binding proteins domain-containing protein n=1 Tax=Spermophilus dauricus TaxID=99837 RepID=A0A8C9P7U0_SPEDA
RSNKLEPFLGTWKLVSSENFEDYMKELEHRNIRQWLNDSRPKMARQRDNNQKKNCRWKNGGGEFFLFSKFKFLCLLFDTCLSSYPLVYAPCIEGLAWGKRSRTICHLPTLIIPFCF